MVIPDSIIPFINLIIIAFIVVQVVLGYKKGFLYQIFSLLRVLVAILISWYFSPELAKAFPIYPPNLTPFSGTSFFQIFYDQLNSLLWHVILFFGVLIIFIILKPFAKVLMNMPILKEINKTLGAVFSLIPTILVLVMISFFVASPLVINGEEVCDKTALGPIHTVSKNVIFILKEPYLVQESLQKIIHGEKLNQEETTLLMQWFLDKDADLQEIKDFLSQHSEQVIVPQKITE